MYNILNIAKKEFWSYVNTPTAYIVTVAFIVPIYFLFWQQTLLANEASLRAFFSLLPWFLLLVIPAITMRSLADEQKNNTLELLMSHSLKEVEVVIGKFIAVLIFYLLILLTTLSLPLTIANYGTLDMGIIFGQYVGALFMGSAMISLGILVSTWFKQSITAFLTTSAIIFLWILLGLDIVTLALPWPLNLIAYQTALLTHSDQLARGLIELRDISYFVTFTAILLALATIKLSESKLVESKSKKGRLYTGAILISAIGIVFNLILTNAPLRIDLTKNQQFTLSSGTKSTLSNLPDIVSVTLYSSKNLPAQVQLVKRDVTDTLKDYSRFGSGKLKFTDVNPDTSPEIAKKASELGVNPIQFNVIGGGKFSVESGYLGLVITYGNQHETIGYIQNPGTLEYDLTQKIRKLTIKEKSTIGFLSGHGEKNLFSDLSLWNEQITSQYETKTVTLDSPDDNIDVKVLVVAGPTESVSEATASGKIREWLSNEGKLLWLIDGTQANPQMGFATPIDNGWDEVLADYGLKLNKDLAYDTQLNENIRISQGIVQYILPYPFWLKALPVSQEEGGSESQDIPEGVLYGWASTITVDENKSDINFTKLMQTSPAGGKIEGALNIAPDSAPKQGSGQPVLLSIKAEKDKTRVVLIGDSELATNDFLQNSPANQTFLTNVLDWLVADEMLSQIPRRQFIPTLLKFNSSKEAVTAQYGNIVGVPIAVGLLGFWWLRRRSRLTGRTYRI